MQKRLTLFFTALLCLHASSALGVWNYERPDGNSSALMGCWSDESVSYTVGFNGAVFRRHMDGAWTDISDPTLAGAALFAIQETTTGAVYASGYRLGTPRFDSNDDGQVNADDTQSRYAVIFHYNGSAWEELSTPYDPESPFFASSFVSIWADEGGTVYFGGGKQRSSNSDEPSGVFLAYDGASFEPLIGTSSNAPSINSIQGTDAHVYLACSSGCMIEFDLRSREFSVMEPQNYAVDFRGVWKDTDNTLYAVAEGTYGYIFRYHDTRGWEPMAIDHQEVPPLYCIAGRGDLLIAAGSYGKAFYLDLAKDKFIWKELLTGTQSHINGLAMAGDDFLAATSGGELYRMTEKDPRTAYILANPPTGIGTLIEGTLTHQATLYDFSLGDIWKREWRFDNEPHRDPVPAFGILYSSTANGVNTAIEITGEGGEESNRELRITDCKDCTPHVDITDTVVKLFIQSGQTTQNTIKKVLEKSTAVSKVTARNGDSPWVISTKEYDRVLLKGGRDNENLFINEATSGDDFYLAVHRFKDRGTYEPSLTVYRENVTFIDGMIKVYGQRTKDSCTTIEVKDDDVIQSKPATGILGDIIEIHAVHGEKGNIKIQLVAVSDAEAKPLLKDNTLYIPMQEGVTTVGAIIQHLTGQELIDTATPKTPATEETLWDSESENTSVILEGGTNAAEVAYDPGTDTVTITIDSGLTTTTNIAEALSTAHDPVSGTLIFTGVLEVVWNKIWNINDHTNTATLPGMLTETVSTTVHVVDENDLDFTFTPTEAKLKATLCLADASDPSLDIIKWEWAVFRPTSSGYETKATVKSETGNAEVTISDLGKYDIGLQATLKDGSTLTMEKVDAIKIKGEHAGESSLEGASGCFVGAASAR
ncbi:hypothetical protein [Desulfoluna sp.]|uniref:hypothetical protein n=1 Tax=Desulfoluna sp. TaxID=2045199 RepID=UPI00260A2D1D|nr:hypothetical protein [Desulfoluna sp.]